MTFDDEEKIIKHFQECGCENEKPLLWPPSKSVKRIFNLIHNENNWKQWTNNSGKNAPPPDFYNDKAKLMLEIMRVDDHEQIDAKNGKVTNPDLAHESELYKELVGKVPQHCNLHIISRTQLPSKQDHNYTFYRNGFVRIIEKHKKKIPLYKKNHPNKKIIFFIEDHSSFYVETDAATATAEPYVNMPACGRPHLFCGDEGFIKCVLNSDIDYLIWHAPYKVFTSIAGIVEPIPPHIVVIDVKAMVKGITTQQVPLHKYNADNMISVEL